MRFASTALFLAAALAVAARAGAAAPAREGHVVTFGDGVPAAEIDRWVDARGATVRYRFHTSNSVWIEHPAGTAVARAGLLADGRVVHVLEELVGVPDALPDDPLFPDQWHCLNNTPRAGGVCSMDADIQADKAWDVVTAATRSVIAVLDDGVLLTHPDLAANLVPGWDVGDDDPDPTPDLGTPFSLHGTPVAGIIGAVGDNGLGSAGVCWSARIMPIKMHPDGAGYTYTTLHAAAAVDYAVAQGVDIINCSWHFEFFTAPSPYSAFYRAFQAASDAGIVVVAAAGNGNLDLDDPAVHIYPAKFAFPNLVTVTISHAEDGGSRNYGHGPGTVDIAAPGVDLPAPILDAQGNPTWFNATGTSAATPLVAGAIALIREARPDLAFPGEVLQLMYDRAEVLPALEGLVAGNRRLNLNRCVAPPDDAPPGPPDLAVVAATSTTATLQWTEPGDDGTSGLLDHFAMSVGAIEIPAQPIYKVYDLPETRGPGSVHTYTLTGLTPGAGMHVQLAAVDDQHNRATAQVFIPPPALAADRTYVFCSARTGEVVTGTVVFRNVGSRETTMAPLLLSGGDWFAFPDQPFVLAPGDSHVFTFTCDAAGLCRGGYPARLGFTGGFPTPIDVMLAVVTDAPEVALAPAAVDLGEVEPETRLTATVTLANPGCADLGWRAGFAAPGPWAVKPQTGVLAAGATVDLLVTVETRQQPPAELVVGSDDPLVVGATVPVTWRFELLADAGAPAGIGALSAYPNPFNPETTIRCDLPGRGPAELRIYDVRGAGVRTLALGDRGPGPATAAWNGRDDRGAAVPSGVYFCRLLQGGTPGGGTLKLNLVR